MNDDTHYPRYCEPPAKEPRPSGSERRLVRQFVVQERYQGRVETNDWFDDPDQPESSTATLEAAKQWMIGDGKESPGHDTTYDHRIIERTEMVVYLPNAGAVTPGEKGQANE